MNTTKNWRIRDIDEHMFFVEADLPNAEENGHYPRIEVMMEDFGDHNGYTREFRRSDAELIVDANLTIQSCGLLPSELKKQNDEMREVLKKVLTIIENQDSIDYSSPLHYEIEDAIKI